MIANDIYIEEKSREVKAKAPITTLFIGSYELAVEILLNLNDKEEAVATKLWRVQFDDTETKSAFLVLCPDARFVEGWWLVKNCVIREWLLEQGGARLDEIVAITFASRRLRDAFIAQTDH